MEIGASNLERKSKSGKSSPLMHFASLTDSVPEDGSYFAEELASSSTDPGKFSRRKYGLTCSENRVFST